MGASGERVFLVILLKKVRGEIWVGRTEHILWWKGGDPRKAELYWGTVKGDLAPWGNYE